jgi:hypothetical protein
MEPLPVTLGKLGVTKSESSRAQALAEIPPETLDAEIDRAKAWVYYHDFKDEDEALDDAVANQRDRRNLTDAEFLSLVAAVYKRRPHGGDRRSGEFNSQRCELNGKQSEAILAGQGDRRSEPARSPITSGPAMHSRHESRMAITVKGSSVPMTARNVGPGSPLRRCVRSATATANRAGV